MPELALELGADELGFVLAPSPRRVEPEAVRGHARPSSEARSDPAGFRAVGVFVNEAPDAMRDIIAFAGLDVAQVHGDEAPSACARLRLSLVSGLAHRLRAPTP